MGRQDGRRQEQGAVMVFAPDRGVGDLMWHLPTLRAIAARAPLGRVMLAARPSSRARELLQAEPAISRTVYLPNRTGALRHVEEAVDAWRLLRRERPGAFWVLEKTGRSVMAAALAGVPERRGFGLGHASQERWLSAGPRLPKALRPAHRIDKLAAFEALHGLDAPDREPALTVPTMAAAEVHRRWGEPKGPWVVLGVGASTPERRWPMERYAAIARGLRGRVERLFWLGGPDDAGIVSRLAAWGPAGRSVSLCNERLPLAAAVMARSAAFLGNDSGPMNLAAAVGLPTIGLFGPTPALTYSRWLMPLVSRDGTMAAIEVADAAAMLHRTLEAGAPEAGARDRVLKRF